ncbi:MAG: hypothetical protein H0X66_17110 [Verrucomicrobia bacterium]|nr:hypothetical protein [Verrucomicrobiota bacterium]
MTLTREQFAENLKQGTEAVRKNIARLCWNELPDLDRYFVILNGSFDGNPLAPGEVLFPDHNMPQTDTRVPRTAEEVVEKLWRAGKVPAWIDISPYEIDGNFLYSELLCCGRFTNEESHLYHKPEGYPPFHIFGPVLPVGYRDLEHDGKFDLHCYRDRKRKT